MNNDAHRSRATAALTPPSSSARHRTCSSPSLGRPADVCWRQPSGATFELVRECPAPPGACGRVRVRVRPARCRCEDDGTVGDLRVSETGLVRRGFFRHRLWRWDEVVVLAWDDQGFLGPNLLGARIVACCAGDPYPRLLQRFMRVDQARARLESLRVDVAPYNVSIVNNDRPTTEWWPLDPRTRKA